ncbi:amidohydrolase-domain-containing protein [Phaeosphaeriaceae sp. PMI808]|nr:amidohydrolase-domain-containing protein [Phaeosphaeriaceae sp. PMI808]
MDQSTGPTAPPKPPTLEHLQHIVNHYPIIDNHAHNLILPTHADTIPFESITTEAQGRALRDTFKSLPHLRAAKQLRQLYELEDGADWDDILEQRMEWLRSDPQRLHRRCFEGVHALLVDDGLAEPQKVYPYNSHDEYLQGPSKRIVRIEAVAEKLMERIVQDADEEDLARTKFLPDIWIEFTDEFEREIQDAVQDPGVAGFKTVICYRTGLDIEPDYEEAARAVGHPFERYVKACIRKRNYRIERKALNDYLVLRTLEILSDGLPHSDSLSKPFQLHTGLGDNDINLRESNPSYLQQIIESYPTVPFVLLHSAYPFTQEAGYLATVYRHVYLDIGEVFPMVSRDGQQTVLRQALELVPCSKLLYSSDGHYFPETFYLANMQFREVWLELLVEYVKKGDLTTFQAIGMTRDIMFNNSNTLYDLRYQVLFDETLPAAAKQLTYNTKLVESPLQSPAVPPIPPAGSTNRPPTTGPVDPRSGSPFEPPLFPPPPKVPQVYDTQRFEDFIKQNPDVRFVYVQWLDYLATIRTRIVPIKEFTRMIRESDRISIPHDDLLPLPNNDHTTTNQINIEPDLRSLRRTHNKDPLPSATVLSYCRSEAGTPLPTCPRTSLEILLTTLQYTHSTTLLLGFEIQATFLSREGTKAYTPLPSHHQPPFLPDILLALDNMAIDILTVHAPPTPKGPHTFTLAPLPPLAAIDTLLQTRQVIAQIAALHGGCATPPDPQRADQFFQHGVEKHVHALSAFTRPFEPSWMMRQQQRRGDRDEDSDSSDDERSAWAKENPVRRISAGGEWELRCINGMANVYFVVAGVVAAGILGLSSAAATAATAAAGGGGGGDGDDEQRKELVRRVPVSVGGAVRALRGDGALREVLDVGLVEGYLGVLEREGKVLGEMSEDLRREVLIERY